MTGAERAALRFAEAVQARDALCRLIVRPDLPVEIRADLALLLPVAKIAVLAASDDFGRETSRRVLDTTMLVERACEAAEVTLSRRLLS